MLFRNHSEVAKNTDQEDHASLRFLNVNKQGHSLFFPFLLIDKPSTTPLQELSIYISLCPFFP